MKSVLCEMLFGMERWMTTVVAIRVRCCDGHERMVVVERRMESRDINCQTGRLCVGGEQQSTVEA